MAKPRIFISSTFYDLRQVRADLDYFIESMGYEAVRHEEGDIPYDKIEELENYCYKEIAKTDIVVAIIGGRYGSESRQGQNSITQREIQTALDKNKQVYIFIEKNVLTEYNTYLINKGNSQINYRYVDNISIYKFIDEIKNLSKNNIIKDFETAQDIVSFLKNQLSGLFQHFLETQANEKERDLIKELENTAENLNKLVQFLSHQNKDQSESINKILMINHPLTTAIAKILKIHYHFYIDGCDDLNALLKAYGYIAENDDEYPEYYFWYRNISNNSEQLQLYIKKELFDENRKLKYIPATEWDEKNVISKVIELTKNPFDLNDLPF